MIKVGYNEITKLSILYIYIYIYIYIQLFFLQQMLDVRDIFNIFFIIEIDYEQL